MNVAEQIEALQNARAAKTKALEAIAQKAIDEGRSMTETEQTEFDDLDGEIDSIDENLKRMAALEKKLAAKAVPAQGVTQKSASESRGGGYVSVLPKKLAPGIAFARLAKCLGAAKGDSYKAEKYAKTWYGDDPRIESIIKADVGAGTTINDSTNWAQGLVGEETAVFADFAEFLRPMTILGKFGNGGVPSLRMVPFSTALIGETEGGAAYWVGEGKAKPLTSFGYSRTTLNPLKVANICPITEELAMSSSPNAEVLIRDALAAAIRAEMDSAFIDPANSGTTDVKPASVLNAATPITSSGNDAAAVREDLRALFGAFIAANNTPTSGVFIMSSTTALALSLLVNALGNPEFPGITMMGGTLMGLPVIASEYVPAVSAGSYVALINAGDIYLGDEGGIRIDFSNQASLEMSTTPGAVAGVPTAQTQKVVSLWQTNSIAFRAERIINWALRRADGAVAYLDQVNWGAGS